MPGDAPPTRLCHVIACNVPGTHVIAAQTPLGWMLPVSAQPMNSSIEEAYNTARADLFSGEFDDYHLVHCCRFEYPPGSGTIHSYCLMRARAGHRADWRSLSRLLSSNAALPEQAAALRLASDRFTTPAAPFDALTESEDMQRWVESSLAMYFAGATLSQIEWRRLARNDAVGTCYTSGGTRVFVKGGPHRANDEARVASALNAHIPRAAPETVTLDLQRNWWLVRDVGGYQIPPAHRTLDWYVKIIDRCTALQRALLDDAGTMRVLGARTVDAGALRDLIPHVMQWAGTNKAARKTPLAPCHAERLLNDVIDRLADLNVPPHWVHFDLSFDNVYMVNGGVPCFIDVEYGCAGPPLLSYGILLRDATQRGAAITRACEDHILSLWAQDDHKRWRACLRDMPVLCALLKMFVMRVRLADYAAESVAAVQTLYQHIFTQLSINAIESVAKQAHPTMVVS